MLGKKYRLPGYEIKKIIRSGMRLTSNFFNCSYVNQDKTTHCAVIVPSRIGKRAVDRNRMKRLTHEALWELIKNKQIKGDFVLMAKINFAEKKVSDVDVDLKKLISEIR